jgi:hypothetical protein
VVWLETRAFLVVYAAIDDQFEEDENGYKDDEPTHDYTVCLVSQKDRDSPITYTVLSDPCPPWGLREREGYYYHAFIRNW